MIANITGRQRKDFTKVNWGPLRGQAILTLFLPDAASPLLLSRDALCAAVDG